MSRRRGATRSRSVPTLSQSIAAARASRPHLLERLEIRVLLSSAFDITQLTNLRQDPNYSNINGRGIGIAVLDTGVYAQNPDLISNFAAYYDAVENPGTTAPDTNPADTVDHVGHGSHTSGIAASSNPAIGVADGAKLIDVRVFADPGEAQFNIDPIDQGLQWVAQNAATFNIKVVNMSLGESINLNYTPVLDQYGQDIQTLEGMGITVVSSSGNSYAQYAAPGASIPAVESTISVGNEFSDNGVGQYDFSGYYGGFGDTWYAQQPSAAPDTFNATSQRSTLFNQVVAPGTDIYSTWNSPAQLHNTDSGTSMAAPFVSGMVALMQQAAFQFGGTYLQPSDVLQLIRNSSDTITDPVNSPNFRAEVLPNGTLSPNQPLPGTGLSYDRVNVYKAIQAVKSFVQGNTGVGADLNNTFATATVTTPLNGQTTVSLPANIGKDGSVFIGPNDVDLYKVTLQVEGDLTVSLLPVTNGTNFDPVLEFFDSSGNLLYSANGTGGTYPGIATPIGQPLVTGTYYVGVSSIGNATYNPVNGSGIAGGTGQGDYLLTAKITNPDPHGVPAVGSPLDLTGPTTLLPTASLGNVPSNYVTDVIGQETDASGNIVQFPNGDVHFYKVVAPDTGELIIQADATGGFYPIIAAAFDSTYTQIGSVGSNLTVPVTLGQTYFIGVTTQYNVDPLTNTFDPINPYNRVTGSTPDTPFQMYVAFSNGDRNGTVAQASTATIGTPVTQQIGTDNGLALLGANGGNKDADFYAFTAPSSGVFDATVSAAGGFVPEMTLWTTTNGINGVQRLEDASQGSLRLYQQVSAGQVVVVSITGQNNQNINGISEGSGAGGMTGTYTLNTSLDPASLLATLSNNSIRNATPTPLTLNTPIGANLGSDGSLYVGPTDIDMYSFVAPATEEYQFATNTNQDNSAQTVLRVFDANGNQLAVNQAVSASSTNSVVKLAMTAGQTYYVGVSGVGPQSLSYTPLSYANAGTGSTGAYTIAATDAGPFQRTLTFVQGQKKTFTDASHHKITVSLSGPGTGELIFLSPNDGNNLSQIMVNGSDAGSTLTINGSTPLGTVDVNGSLRAFNAPQDTLTGSMTVTGSLGNLNLAATLGGNSISIGSGGRLNAHVTTLTDESLISAEPVGNFTATNWTISGTTRYQISAPSIQNLTVRGTFNDDIVAGTIGRLNLGTLAGSAIRADTSIAAINAAAAQNSEIFVNVNPALTALPATAADFTTESGSLKSIVVRGAFSGTEIAAWNVGTVTLNNLQTANATPFGVTANTLSHFRAVPTGGKPIILKNVFAPYSPVSLGGNALVRIVG